MRNLPNTMTTNHDPVYVIVYMGMCLLLAVIGLWLALSYLRRSKLGHYPDVRDQKSADTELRIAELEGLKRYIVKSLHR